MIFNSKLENINVYEAGKPIELVVRDFGVKPEDIVKLASNENPRGCSTKVSKKVSSIVENMALYPDDSMYELKEKLANFYNVKSSNTIIGAGSDQIIEFIMHAKGSSKAKILINSVTFAMYEIYASHVGADVIKTTSISHDLDQFYKLYKEHNPDIIFLCVPNNPTGDCLDAKEVFDFIEKIDDNTLVVVDGAYMEYAKFKDSKKSIEPASLIEKFNNVIYLGTFSKAYGLGGMRVGYGISNNDIIKNLYKLRPPFNITTLSLAASIEALDDQEFVQSSIKLCFDQMRRYEDSAKSKGFEYINSYTNFITLIFNDDRDSSQIAQNLLKLGMIVRDLKGYGLNAIRVTIGTASQNDRFFELFEKVD